MTTKTYRHPGGSRIREVDSSDSIKIAALEKLGWKEITGEDITNDPKLTVVYEKVTPATAAVEPPALPRLVKPVPSAPTRETDAAAQVTSGAITSEDVEPLKSEDVQPLTGGKAEKGARG